MFSACGSAEAESGSRLRAAVLVSGSIGAALALAVVSAEGQGLLWLARAQQPIRWAGEAVQPWLPASRAVWGEGPFPAYPAGFRSLGPGAGVWSMIQCDALANAQVYWLLHLAVFLAAAVRVRSSGPADAAPGLGRWARVLTISALIGMAIPWLGQIMWTFAGAVERAAIAAVSVVDPATGNTIADGASVPATGPFARGGIIAGCVLLDAAVAAWLIARMYRTEAGRGARDRCAGCGYPRVSESAMCPECGAAPGGSTAGGWRRFLAAALRGGLAALIGLLMLTPFVLGWIGAALPDAIWLRWVPF
ncbi:MAG: hypothetical protein IT436_08575 [Phycisphaerales bacterium]|nr:hypothetical protein [Phycisphaerales bacterium]